MGQINLGFDNLLHLFRNALSQPDICKISQVHWESWSQWHANENCSQFIISPRLILTEGPCWVHVIHFPVNKRVIELCSSGSKVDCSSIRYRAAHEIPCHYYCVSILPHSAWGKTNEKVIRETKDISNWLYLIYYNKLSITNFQRQADSLSLITHPPHPLRLQQVLV